jgi:hypothetical protein
MQIGSIFFVARLRRFAAALLLAFGALVVDAAPSQAIVFTLLNGDDPGEGFNDLTYGAQRLQAVNYALNIWSNVLASSYTGETIQVLARFDSLGGDLFGAPGAQAGAVFSATDFIYTYVGPLANHIVQEDLFPGNDASSDPYQHGFEIFAQFNSDIDNNTVLGTSNWYYGTDGHPGTDIDLVTVALHEIMHGLGFTTTYDNATGGYSPTYFDIGDGNGPQPYYLPSLFDAYLTTNVTGGTALTSMTEAERQAAATSNNLYWDGDFGIAANGGVRPRIYSPLTFQQGSSLIHLDEATYGNDLISPVLGVGQVIHAPSLIDLGMLRDLGWDIAAVPEPSGFVLTAAVAGTIGAVRRRRRRGIVETIVETSTSAA